MFRLFLAVQSCFAFAPVDPPDRLDRLAKEVFTYTAVQILAAAPPASAVPADPIAFILREPGKTYSYRSTSILVQSGTIEPALALDSADDLDFVGRFEGAERVIQNAHFYIGVIDGNIFARAKSKAYAAWELRFPPPKHGLKFQATAPGETKESEHIWWYLGDYTDPQGRSYKGTFALFAEGDTFKWMYVYSAGLGSVYRRHYSPAYASDPLRKQEYFLVNVESAPCSEKVRASDKP